MEEAHTFTIDHPQEKGTTYSIILVVLLGSQFVT